MQPTNPGPQVSPRPAPQMPPRLASPSPSSQSSKSSQSSAQSVSAFRTLVPYAAPQRRPYSFIRDVYYGTILGDFAPEVQLPGAILHALLGFVPLIGSLIALRDVTADWLDSDWLGLALNSLAVFPVFGGIPKIFAVIHAFLRVHRYMRRSVRRGASGITDKEVTRRRVGRLQALGISLLMPVFGFLYGIGVILSIELINNTWPTHLGIGSYTTTLALITLGLLSAIGFGLGELICARTHAWLGVVLLPLGLGIIVLPAAFTLLGG